MEPNELMTPREVAELLRLSLDATYNLLHRKAIPGRKIGGTWRTRRSELMRHISTNS